LRGGGRIRPPPSGRNLLEPEDVLSEIFPRLGSERAQEPIRIYTGGPNQCGECLEILAIVRIEGTSRSQHRRSANSQLYDDLEASPGYSNRLDKSLGANVMESMRAGRELRNPPGTEWHHPAGRPDQVWLIRRCEHRDPLFQDFLHPGPGGTGGYGMYYRGGNK
jgi:hypothetical protein